MNAITNKYSLKKILFIIAIIIIDYSSSSYAESAMAFKLATPTGLKIKYPSLNSTLQQQTFSWSNVLYATSYRIVISQNDSWSGFTDKLDKSECNGTCITKTIPANSVSLIYSYSLNSKDFVLQPNTTYYWKVRAGSNVQGVEYSTWSSRKSFTTTKHDPVNNCDSGNFHITKIPCLMRKNDWTIAANLMSYWFDGSGKNYYLSLDDITALNSSLADKVTKLADPTATQTFNNETKIDVYHTLDHFHLLPPVSSSTYKDLLRKLLETELNTTDAITGERVVANTGKSILSCGGTFDYITQDSKFLAKHPKWASYPQEQKDLHFIAEETTEDTNEITHFMAAFGASAVRLVTKGKVEMINGKPQITVNYGQVYFHDSYDFIAKAQPLGFWSLEKPYVSRNPLWNIVTNDSFRLYNWSRGVSTDQGDFRIFSFPTKGTFRYATSPQWDAKTAITPCTNSLFTGKTINYQYRYPSIDQSYTDNASNGDFVVGSGVEISNIAVNWGTIDISDSNILVNFAASDTPNTSGSFNGFEIFDILNKIDDFKSVKINSSTNMIGLDSSRITFDANHIWVNWQGLSFDSNTVVSLDINK